MYVGVVPRNYVCKIRDLAEAKHTYTATAENELSFKHTRTPSLSRSLTPLFLSHTLSHSQYHARTQ